MSVRNHKDLDVWSKAIDFVTRLYGVTKNFPREELYGIVSQLRRAAVSIASNISEGATRQSKKEFIQFLYVSLSSASEIDVQLIISKNLKYLSENEFLELSGERESISKMLSGLIRSIKS